MKAFKDFFSFAPSQAIYVPIICIGIFMTIVGVLSLWCTPKGIIIIYKSDINYLCFI